MLSRGRTRYLVLGALVAALSMVLQACTSEEPTPTTGPAAQPTAALQSSPTQVPAGPKRGGQVVLGWNVVPDILDPIYPVANQYGEQAMFDALISPNNQMIPTPQLAESWDVSENTYTFHLRKNVKWTDGVPFTANDVKFSWEMFCHPDNAVGRAGCEFLGSVKGQPEYLAGEAAEITGVRVIDDHTLQVELTRSSATFLSIGAGFAIHPKHKWENIPVLERPADPMATLGKGSVGTGPFIVDSYESGGDMIMHANMDYFGGAPYLDQVVLRQCRARDDGVSIFSQLKVGQVQAVGQWCSLLTDFVDEAQADPSLETRPLVGFRAGFVGMNLLDPLFSDIRVRKALSYAINRQALIDTLWGGKTTFLNSCVNPVFTWAVSQDVTAFDNDVEKARQLFEEAGWTLGADGILQKDGVKFDFNFVDVSGGYGTIVAAQWKELGVNARLESTTFGPLWAILSKDRFNPTGGEFQAWGLSVPNGLANDPSDACSRYRSSAYVNFGRWDNSRYDELLDLGDSTGDIGARGRYYKEAAEVMAQDVPHIFVGQFPDVWAWQKGLVIPERKTGYLTFLSLPEWYWEN